MVKMSGHVNHFIEWRLGPWPGLSPGRGGRPQTNHLPGAYGFWEMVPPGLPNFLKPSWVKNHFFRVASLGGAVFQFPEFERYIICCF